MSTNITIDIYRRGQIITMQEKKGIYKHKFSTKFYQTRNSISITSWSQPNDTNRNPLKPSDLTVNFIVNKRFVRLLSFPFLSVSFRCTLCFFLSRPRKDDRYHSTDFKRIGDPVVIPPVLIQHSAEKEEKEKKKGGGGSIIRRVRLGIGRSCSRDKRRS